MKKQKTTRKYWSPYWSKVVKLKILSKSVDYSVNLEVFFSNIASVLLSTSSRCLYSVILKLLFFCSFVFLLLDTATTDWYCFIYHPCLCLVKLFNIQSYKISQYLTLCTWNTFAHEILHGVGNRCYSVCIISKFHNQLW